MNRDTLNSIDIEFDKWWKVNRWGTEREQHTAREGFRGGWKMAAELYSKHEHAIQRAHLQDHHNQ